MPVRFILVDGQDNDAHCYRVHAPDPESDWIAELAQCYVDLRTACAVPLNEISLDGIDVVGVEQLRERLHAACVPERRKGIFDPVRSDFGETIAYELLEQVYGTKIGYKGVRDRELVAFPGRGIDAVGVEDGPKLTLVLGETKVSDEDRCPPRVVDENDDSMRNQHLGHMERRVPTARKIMDWGRRVPDAEVRDRFLRASLLLEHERWDQLQVIACCVLVRPESLFAHGDFGTFHSTPVDFQPADVRFLVVCLPERVEQVIAAWDEVVRETRSAA